MKAEDTEINFARQQRSHFAFLSFPISDSVDFDVVTQLKTQMKSRKFVTKALYSIWHVAFVSVLDFELTFFFETTIYSA